MMFEVNIYIETSLKGPVVRDGWYAAILEFTTKNKKTITREDFEMQTATTYHRQSVCAFLKSLKRLNASCTVNVYMDSVYLRNGVEDYVKMWKSNSWINAKGDVIKNAKEWQEIAKLISGQRIIFHTVKSHKYTLWMMKTAKGYPVGQFESKNKAVKTEGDSVNTEREDNLT